MQGCRVDKKGQRLREGRGCSNLVISLIARLWVPCQQEVANKGGGKQLMTPAAIHSTIPPLASDNAAPHARTNTRYWHNRALKHIPILKRGVFHFHQETLLRWDKMDRSTEEATDCFEWVAVKILKTATVPLGQTALKRLCKTPAVHFCFTDYKAHSRTRPNTASSAVSISLSHCLLEHMWLNQPWMSLCLSLL